MNIIEILQKYLQKYKKVLEIGSKKGEDLELLNAYYEIVASEDEKRKTRYLKDNYLDIRVILLDPILIDTHKRFDCIYSRNLLDEFSLEQIIKSFDNQKNILEKDGLIFHIFNEKKVPKDDIEKIVSTKFKIVEINSFDSNFYIIAKLI